MPDGGIAGTIHPRCPVEGIDLKAGIVGKTVHVIVFPDVAGFLKGILLQCGARLRDIDITANILQR